MLRRSYGQNPFFLFYFILLWVVPIFLLKSSRLYVFLLEEFMDTEIRAPTHLLHCFFYKKLKKIEKSYESDEFITFMKGLIFELTNCVMRVMNSSLLYYFFNLALSLSVKM